MEHIRLTALVEADETGYVALCPELDIASEGETVEEARANLTEALELFFEVAPPAEVARHLGPARRATDPLHRHPEPVEGSLPSEAL